MAEALRSSAGSGPLTAWVYFTDKADSRLHLAPAVSERSLRRRARVLPADRLVDESDLHVSEAYVRQVASRVHRVRHRSRSLNAVSVVATGPMIEQLETLPFVERIDLVGKFPRDRVESFTNVVPPPASTARSRGAGQLDYGESLNQLRLCSIPDVHALGNSGQGVLIGVFDNGFRLLSHRAFDSLRTRIVATYDFVDHKVSVVPNNPDPGFGAHGILVLSTLAGYAPGSLIGPAYGSGFVLARTENDSSETPLEEDNFVAAIEWADSIGVDVTSTSLGYLEYDPPYAGWTWVDMDGKTTPISRAAAQAVRKGIVVVNSAGNNGYHPDHNTLNAPADADSVLAVGAVSPNGSRASFSSVGPTTSTPPRIKPDVMAQGMSVWAASATNVTGFGYGQGTSFSCPLVAGVAAQLLHAKPTATPVEICNALRLTASRAQTPDNLYGWGVVNAIEALRLVTGARPTRYAIVQNYPNPFNARTEIVFALPEPSTVTLKIFDVLGREVHTLLSESRPAANHRVTWDGRDSRGAEVASGVYFCRMEARSTERREGDAFAGIAKLVLIQ